MAYIGTQPKDVRSFGRAKFDFTATQGQTAFTGADDDSKTLGFTDGQIEVYVNGILMDESDFTTSNGNTVTLASAANLNDIISIVAMQTDIPNSDYVPASGGTFTGETIHNQNVLVGKTVSDGALTGHELRPSSFAVHTVSGGAALYARRNTNDGDIMVLQGNSGTVGSVGTSGGDLLIHSTAANHGGVRFGEGYVFPVTNSGATSDGGFDLGLSVGRWKDLYLSGGAYLGGTAATNYLDDYEEGSWTPVLTGMTVTSGTLDGSYRKIGGVVTATMRMENATLSGTHSGARIEGLPYNNSKRTSSGIPSLYNHQSGNLPVTILIEGGTSLSYFQYNTTSYWVGAPWSAGANRYMAVQLVYNTTS